MKTVGLGWWTNLEDSRGVTRKGCAALDCRCGVGENLHQCADSSENSALETTAVTDKGLCLQEILIAGA